jgi:hypothetical protein
VTERAARRPTDATLRREALRRGTDASARIWAVTTPEHARAVACSRCGAGAGELCRQLRYRTLIEFGHGERHELAIRCGAPVTRSGTTSSGPDRPRIAQ